MTDHLSPRAYRWLDRTSKLLGIALIAAGLEAGGDTTAGLALAALGVAAGLATVFVDAHPTDADADSSPNTQ